MTMTVTVSGRTHVGRVRATNEDAFVTADFGSSSPVQATDSTLSLEVKQRGILLAVSDGMGGAQAGEVASDIVLQTIVRGMQVAKASSAAVALRTCVETANQAVWRAAHEQSGHEGMGATLTAVLFFDGQAYVAQVGDSRAYVLRGSHISQVTHDQSLVQQLLDAGSITREEAGTFEHRNIILQGVGTSPKVMVAMNRFPVRQRDRFLLCSDGLTGKVEEQELRRILSAAESVELACVKLIELALERGGEDNITAMVADVGGEGVPELTEVEAASPQGLTGFLSA